MPSTGGLKLTLDSATRDDRRARFAEVSLTLVGSDDRRSLVTDAQGRMRFRLADGDYLLRTAHGHESCFAVRDGRWTTVRVRLP